MRRLAIAVFLAAASGAAWADLSVTEKGWARACTERLAADSERVRAGAEAALGKLGTEAIPTVLSSLAALKTDDHWASLGRALAAMSRVEAAAALEALAPSWPKGHAARLDALVKELRTKPQAVVDQEAAQKVRSILATFDGERSYSSDEPRVREIVALGRAAVPTLLAELRKRPRLGSRRDAAADALAGLAIETDLPHLAALLREGTLVAARCVANLKDPEVVKALLVPLEKGLLDDDLSRALLRHRSDPRVPKAMLAWLEQHGSDGSFEVAHAAGFLADCGEKAAVPLLSAVLADEPEGTVAVRVAKALAALGEKRGIPVLIDVLDKGDDDDARHEAGEALNAVRGESTYSGRSGPGRTRGDFSEAADKFRAWWAASKDRLRFDETRRAWTVEPPASR